VATNLRELRPLRGLYSGVLWQHPVVLAAMPVVDRADRLVRRRRGLEHLPPFSVRVRSASIVGEFGGQRWSVNGERLKQTLVEHMGLTPDRRVLEVGCGGGRQALALAGYLPPGGYVGFDIDEQAIRACQASPALATFRFFAADVENEVYRPGGATKADAYRFPLDDDSFDLVFLASVFTHMLQDDCANYAREIMRVLAPGGTAAVSTYLRTPPVAGQAHTFDARAGGAYVEYPEVPTKLVAYELESFERWFEGSEVKPLLGRWRQDGSGQTGEWQDWVVVRAPH
jgi:ubiquinone/menaquinone biosynthesis C-methylase UbiE